MKIAVTGASGFVGRMIVPDLIAAGHDVLSVGRTPDPEHADQSCTYETLAERAKGFDAIVHLAAKNNDQSGDFASFRAANVELLQTILTAAKTAGIAKFINVTTLQAQNDENASFYAITKAEAEALLDENTGMNVQHLRLPIVYGDSFRGKLSILNKLPKVLRPIGLKTLSLAKPVVHSSVVSKAVLDSLASNDPASTQRTRVISDSQHDNQIYGISKLIFDFAVALILLGLLFIPLIIVWGVVQFSSPGPGLFVQTRVGRNGRNFKLYKFRTMAEGTKQAGTHEVSAASVTQIGAFLRRTKVDELPQLVNILKNEMTLVGPRPCLPSQTELVHCREELGVAACKPGVTGLAQIMDVDMSDPLRLARLDADYVARRTLLLDLKIILKTVRGGGRGDRVDNSAKS